MMLRLFVLSAFTLSAPVVAQEGAAELTAERALECAVLFASASGNAETETDRLGAASAVSYFIGRYEAASGRQFNEAATLAFTLDVLTKAETLAPLCQAAALDIGNRMTTWGKAIQEQGRRMQESGE